MIPRPRVGMFGGTFDPVHVGHLAVAHAAEEALDLDRIRFIPSAHPPHRAEHPRASGHHRLEMLRRAIAQEPGQKAGWEACDLELRREGPSYSIDTLVALHAEGLTPLQIFLITGADAFADIATWHRYPEVLEAAHFAVVTRPGFAAARLRERLPALSARMIHALDLDDASVPRIVLIEADTPDVSSTDVRRRLARGNSVTDLVPSSVCEYMEENSLYREASASLVLPPGSANRGGGPDVPGA